MSFDEVKKIIDNFMDAEREHLDLIGKLKSVNKEALAEIRDAKDKRDEAEQVMMDALSNVR